MAGFHLGAANCQRPNASATDLRFIHSRFLISGAALTVAVAGLGQSEVLPGFADCRARALPVGCRCVHLHGGRDDLLRFVTVLPRCCHGAATVLLWSRAKANRNTGP